ncbi:MAG: hydrogenase maturation nickel metallochaperone HypA [Candidatus Eremiobacteraeota bacterium]|nr:hydrogenase maturation nickel metallochaperone HypA [Candidatus Eremiobacteraeota bacterium]
MHEISIAVDLIESVSKQAEARGIDRVQAVRIRVGALTGVVKDSLLFAWDVATAGTLVEGAALKIDDVPLVVYCPVCRTERILKGIPTFECPECGTPTPEIRRGRELELIGVEVA